MGIRSKYIDVGAFQRISEMLKGMFVIRCSPDYLITGLKSCTFFLLDGSAVRNHPTYWKSGQESCKNTVRATQPLLVAITTLQCFRRGLRESERKKELCVNDCVPVREFQVSLQSSNVVSWRRCWSPFNPSIRLSEVVWQFSQFLQGNAGRGDLDMRSERDWRPVIHTGIEGKLGFLSRPW